MAVLLDLSDDILCDIFESFKLPWRFGFGIEKDNRTLSHLARTNRRLNLLASRILMRVIQVEVVTKVNNENGFRFDKLLETLISNAALASLVCDLDLMWDGPREYDEKTPESDEGLANEKSNKMLALLPNIESLSISTGNDCWPFRLVFLKENPALKLRKLQLPWFGTTFNDIIKYLSIPNLDYVSVSYPNEKLDPDMVETRKGLPRYELSTFYIGTSNLPVSRLSTLFGLLSGVKDLRMGLPYSTIEAESSSDKDETGLSPKNVAHLLTSFEQSLVELWLWYDGNPRYFESHDGSRSDLSGLASLRKLNIPSACFFAPNDFGYGREGVWRLLPPRLEELKIWFDHDKDFVYTKEELDTVFKQSELRTFELRALPKKPQRYSWLHEIAEHKANHFSNLAHVAVEEKRFQVPGIRCMHHVMIRPWRVPSALKRVFVEAGINLKVKVRIPKPRLPEKHSWGTSDEEDGDDKDGYIDDEHDEEDFGIDIGGGGGNEKGGIGRIVREVGRFNID